MAQLSDEELREAAAEAGISPHELRHALAQRDGTALDRPEADTGLVESTQRGEADTVVEGRVRQAPNAALAAVRASIERQTGRSGHRQGEDEVDIVDDSIGLNYRMKTRDDGGSGALVRVELDTTSGRSFRNLAATGTVGATLVFLGLAMLIGSWTLGVVGLGIGGLGAWVVLQRTAKLARGLVSARAVASQALSEADDAAAKALPPGR